jgi:hypothetical protein
MVLRGGGVTWARLVAHARARRMVLAEAAPIAGIEDDGRPSANPYSFARILLGPWVATPWRLPALGLRRGLRRIRGHGL